MLGQTISHYRILEKLGQGGMGEIYLAEDTRLGRKVALKFIAPALAADREALLRFQNEARAVAELSHPNIATLHDISDDPERPFLVFEYLEGHTLKDRIVRGSLPVSQVVELGKSLASGLAEAHAKGITHRDIKPANIMLSDSGVAKILDFGLARRADATQITAAGTTLGTMGYMSPEQLQGQELDARTDIWSLGVVLYECLAGRHPFEAESNEAVGQRIVQAPLTPLSAVRDGIPPALDSAIQRCLEKDRDARLQDAQDLIAALRAVESASHPTMSPVAPAKPKRWLLIAVPLGIVLAVALFLTLRDSDAPDIPTPPRLAVLGFKALAAETSGPNLAGLVALVHAGLSASPAYRVISPEYLEEVEGRNSGGTLDLARAADATHVLTGEIQEDGTARRATWRIIDAADGSIVETGVIEDEGWSSLAASISRDVSAELAALGTSGEATPSIVEVLGSDDPVAYQHFSAAMLAIQREELEAAREELLAAVERDSTFALAHYELSKLYNPDRETALAKSAAMAARRHETRLGRKERMLLRGHEHLLDYEVSSAIAAYDEALSFWPDSREALLGRAETQFFFRRWNDSLASAIDGLRFYPEEQSFVVIQLASLLTLGRWESALSLVEASRSLDNPEVDAPRAEAVIRFRLGDHELAGRLYEEILAQEPEDADARKTSVLPIYGRERLAEAIVRMESFLDGTTDDEGFAFITSWFYMGLDALLADAGRIRELRELEETGTRTQAILYAGLPAAALEYLDASVDFEEGNSRANAMRLFRFSTLIRCRAALGEWQEAQADFDRYQEILAHDPEYPRGFVQRGLLIEAEIELARGDAMAAQDALRKLFREGFARFGPFEISVLQAEARAHAMVGNIDQAIAGFEELTRVFGGRTLAHLQLAKLYEEAGRLDDAEARYTACLRLWENADDDYPFAIEARERLAALGR